jgi:hypothetical protein
MLSSAIRRRVVVVRRADVSEEHIALISSENSVTLATAPRRHIPKDNILQWLLVRKQITPAERPPRLENLVPDFTNRGCCVDSPTDNCGRQFRFSRSGPLLLPSSSSIILTRLSVPHSRPNTSQKIWHRRGIEPWTSGSVA